MFLNRTILELEGRPVGAFEESVWAWVRGDAHVVGPAPDDDPMSRYEVRRDRIRLVRGSQVSAELARWLQDAVARDARMVSLGESGEEESRWLLRRAVPLSWAGALGSGCLEELVLGCEAVLLEETPCAKVVVC